MHGYSPSNAWAASGDPTEVPGLCREVIAELTDAGLAMQALPALALLREAAAMGVASRALIRDAHVHVRGVGVE